MSPTMKKGTLQTGWRWVVTEGKHPCPRCAGLNGKKFFINPQEGQASIHDMPDPPLHPHCQCTYVEMLGLAVDPAQIQTAPSGKSSPYPVDRPFIRGGVRDPKLGLVWCNNGRAVTDGPVYEKYSGANWTSGQNPNNIDGHGPDDIDPADDMDACFARHDFCYMKGDHDQRDSMLVAELEALSEDPDDWERPATDREYAMEYRKRAVFIPSGSNTPKLASAFWVV
jgi:hypothetical protein